MEDVSVHPFEKFSGDAAASIRATSQTPPFSRHDDCWLLNTITRNTVLNDLASLFGSQQQQSLH